MEEEYKVELNILKEDAAIYTELKAKNPKWWQKLKENKEVYIDIRKDNYINAYIEGGSICRIHYCTKHKEFQTFTHKKYFPKGVETESTYIKDEKLFSQNVDNIIKNVKSVYSRKKGEESNKEDWSESYIKGQLIINHRSLFLDSEFGYTKGKRINKIDLVQCKDGKITFVELKRINDARMLRKDEQLDPEVIEQMDRYTDFVKKYKEDLLDYYQRLYDIKQDLGLDVPTQRPTEIEERPLLLIFDVWEKENENEQRINHTEKMEKKLKDHQINYRIIKNLSDEL